MPSFSRLVLAVSILTWVAMPTLAQDAITIDIVIKDHKFQPAEPRAPAGKPIVLRVKNQDPTAEEFESNSLKVEKVIAGNSEALIRIRPLAPGRYTFFGEYHEDTAQGALIAE